MLCHYITVITPRQLFFGLLRRILLPEILGPVIATKCSVAFGPWSSSSPSTRVPRGYERSPLTTRPDPFTPPIANSPSIFPSRASSSTTRPRSPTSPWRPCARSLTTCEKTATPWSRSASPTNERNGTSRPPRTRLARPTHLGLLRPTARGRSRRARSTNDRARAGRLLFGDEDAMAPRGWRA